MYQGIYHGSKKHSPDLDKVLARGWSGGLDKMIVTGGSLGDSKKAIELARCDRKYSSSASFTYPLNSMSLSIKRD